MSSNADLDLRGVVLPVSLLMCKSALVGMDANAVLNVLVEDPDVVQELVKIIERSQKRAVRLHEERNHFRIEIGPRREPQAVSEGH
jgi:TusA-related sulfurtransferase